MKHPDRGVPRLLKNWDQVARKIRKVRHVTVFLDFDGTLVAIAPRPEMVRLTPPARKILRRLARHPRATLVIISGRRRPELLEHIGIPGIHYFGLYGWERTARPALPGSVRVALRRLRTHLDSLLVEYPAVWIENKRSSLSIHLLDVPPSLRTRIQREIRARLKPFRKTLHAVENIRDVEILPRSIPGKGIAVACFLAQPAHRKSFPFYFGDDFSDESGFAAARHGISVHVGRRRPTRARFNLRNPAEVAIVLAKLEATISERAQVTKLHGKTKSSRSER